MQIGNESVSRQPHGWLRRRGASYERKNLAPIAIKNIEFAVSIFEKRTDYGSRNRAKNSWGHTLHRIGRNPEESPGHSVSKDIGAHQIGNRRASIDVASGD